LEATSNHPPGDTLFTGTAAYYARFRPPYPDELSADILAQFPRGSDARLLDLGCGPGTLTLPLAPHFSAVVGVDPSSEMIDEARRQPGADAVEWMVMRAEDVPPELGPFDVVSCGSSFHWMARDVVLTKVEGMLRPGGGIALVGGGGGWWDGPEDWHKVVTAVVRKYLGAVRRAGACGFAQMVSTERFEETLARNGWTVTFERDYSREHTWDVDSLVGFLWSTSFAGKAHFGDRVAAFEGELREELLSLRPDGRFTETFDAGLVCGRPV
jgi:SAM-dependent methyltransferase